MQQYNAIKAKYPGALLLFRVGDFYETFGEDAVKTSQILGIVLTRRGMGPNGALELAGFPHHSLDNYLSKLVRAGQRVAICDQLEDPKATKTIVKRGVTELITPGVAYSDNILSQKSNNYLAAVYFEKNSIGVSFVDIYTDEKLVLVCMHGRAMRLLLCLLANKPLSEMGDFPHLNTTLYKVELTGDKFSIVEFNNTDHLK